MSEDVVAQTGATEYEDDNQEGEVVITDLNEGTYTLVAKAYEGFALPDAAEVSLVKYTVIENILESVVYEDESTIQEDPENGRDDEPEDETVKAPVAKSSAKTAAAKAPARQERISRPAPSTKITPMRTSKRSSPAANKEV